MKLRELAMILTVLPLLACGEGAGMTSADAKEAAKERVRQSLGLTQQSALFSKVFVGKPVGGDTVLCGVVEGNRADGSAIKPRRFIVATDPGRWLKFGPADADILPSKPDKFIEWHPTCAGEEEV